MAAAVDALETHRSYIIELYRDGLSEELIADDLALRGVETSHYDIYDCLRRWNPISSPSSPSSPSSLHSRDAIDSDVERQQNSDDLLSITCHHGEDSHASQSNLARIPSHPTSIKTYERDVQSHENLAYCLQLPVSDADNLCSERRVTRLKNIHKSLKEHDLHLSFATLLRQLYISEVTDEDFLKGKNFSGDVAIPQRGRQNRPLRGQKRKRQK